MRLSPYPSGCHFVNDIVSLSLSSKPHSLSSRRFTPTLSMKYILVLPSLRQFRCTHCSNSFLMNLSATPRLEGF